MDGKLIVTDIVTGPANHIAIISSWLRHASRALLALDAPLGWPRAMGENLLGHKAGVVVNAEPNAMFRRYTDTFIKQKLNKQPLDVGANLIARTAWFALDLVESIRKEVALPMPLAWSPDFAGKCAAIEVYPAATLESRGIASSGYKKLAEISRRKEILSLLDRELQFECARAEAIATDDNLDSVLCLLAASDFLADKTYSPPVDNIDTIEKEGWIWVRRKDG